MNIHFDINKVFTDLHEQHRTGKLTADAYRSKLRTILIRGGKLLPPEPEAPSAQQEPEHSGCLTYGWQPDGEMSISFRIPWDGQCRLNTFPRHVRQVARVELDTDMTDSEAAKLAAARRAGEAIYEAVMDDILCQRAEAIYRTQGPDTKRAVNVDERFHLADNPDLIRKEELAAFVDGPRADDDRER